MSDIRSIEIPELKSLVNARIENIKQRNQAEEAARKMEKQLKKHY